MADKRDCVSQSSGRRSRRSTSLESRLFLKTVWAYLNYGILNITIFLK